MANRRNLKKNINRICCDLFSECIAVSLYGDKKESDVNSILSSIVIINNDYISRVSHAEPGMKPGTYFKDVKSKFNAQINELVDNIANL